MVKVRSVYLEPIEGVGEATLFQGPTAMADAQKQLRKWGFDAPAPETGCYDKTDFVVTFQDGDTYSGRYDLQGDGLAGGKTIAEQMVQFVGFIAGTYRPAWCSDEEWASICERNKDRKAEALEWLETYEVA